MIDIKEKIKELCIGHLDETLVESFLNKYSAHNLYDDFIKDMFTEGDNINIDDNYSLSVWKFEDNIEYTLLDYTSCTEDDGEPKELNSFTLKNSNPNTTNISVG